MLMSKRIVRRVLVADDDPKQLEAARSWLHDREVLLEVDASKVVARVRDERPCLVILDLWQSDRELDGHKLAETIKAELPKLPVPVISAGLTPRVAAILARRGAADLILPKHGRRTFEEILAFVERGIEPDPWSDGESSIIEVKRDYARGVLARVGGNKAEAARRAGVTWATFHRWLDDDSTDGAEGGGKCDSSTDAEHT